MKKTLSVCLSVCLSSCLCELRHGEFGLYINVLVFTFWIVYISITMCYDLYSYRDLAKFHTFSPSHKDNDTCCSRK